MADRLKEITTQYHTFVDNQVLTKDRLNEFIRYFEDQDRLSRVFLHGVGIVCGFKLDYNFDNSRITISQGVGITTDGDLVQLRTTHPQSPGYTIDLQSITYTHFKKFEDNIVGYPFFLKNGTDYNLTGEEPIQLWEIFPKEVENSKPLNEFPNLQNMVVLLYLEAYAKEGELCTTIDCDSQGIEQVSKLRVLLVSKEDADYIAQQDSIFSKHNVLDEYIELPEIGVRRVVLNPVNTANYDELKRAYYDAISKSEVRELVPKAILRLVDVFGPILQLNVTNNQINRIIERFLGITGFSPYEVPFDIQYRYDFVCDVADTYNELKKLLLSLKEECCPDIKAFPKHLLLGDLDEIFNPVKHHRHDFYRAPASQDGLGILEHCRSLVNRLLQLIDMYETKTGDIKITPSKINLELSKRAIPFYYFVHPQFLIYWNYFKTKRFAQNTNLSYHTAHLSPAPYIQTPMFFDINSFNHYRIEGHQGKDYKQVMEFLEDKKEEYGVAFDVKALSININTEDLNIDDYQCEFEDLDVLLRAWIAEQECIMKEIASFFSAFRVDEPGKNFAVKEQTLGKGDFRVETGSLFSRSSSTFSSIRDFEKKFTIETGWIYPKITQFKLSNVIIENITTRENSLGKTMKEAFDATTGGSVNDIIAKADYLIKDIVNTDEWNSQPQVKELVIDNSIQLMAYAHVLSRKMPSDLIGIRETNIKDYELTLQDLCDFVKQVKTSYQTVQNLSVGLRTFMGSLINQLSIVCCSGIKLEILMKEIEERKGRILERLQLAKFVENHPGLEHKAGVQPGGTFILVYYNRKQKETGRELELSRQNPYWQASGSRNLSSRKGYSFNTEERSGQILNRLAEIDESVIGRAWNQQLQFLGRIIRGYEIPNNTVVADFALPYLCCSDCAPVNFIVQKPPAMLRLEKENYCIGLDESPLMFDVYPDDAVIKANPEVLGVKIEGKKLFIEEEIFPDEMLGVPIHFTANEQITDAQIIVYRAVQFDFEVPESPTSQTEITFIPSGNLEGATFYWDFGDGTHSEERNPTHKYTLPVNADNTVTVMLTVTAPNGVCKTSVSHDITFIEEEIEITLDSKDFCETDETKYRFSISPEGADPVIEGPGVQVDDDGNYVFVPVHAPIGVVKFNVNGEESDFTATIHARPDAAFEPSQVGNQMILMNESTGEIASFLWKVKAEGYEREFERDDDSPVIIDLTPESPNYWNIELIAYSDWCWEDIAEGDFETEYIEDPNDTCIEEAKAIIHSDFKVLLKTNIPSSPIVNSVWESTSQLYGGTADYNDGVLDDTDAFLEGEHNDQLESMFKELLSSTSHKIIEINRDEFPQEYRALVTLFTLQLKLFYNILGCQEPDVINEYAEQLVMMLDFIHEILQTLRYNEVELPPSLRNFFMKYLDRVGDISWLKQHVQKLLEEGLV